MTLISVKPRRWTRAEYHRMGEAGFFEKERVELLRGEVVSMSPHDPLHAGAVENANNLLSGHFGAQYSLRVQLPMAAPDQSEPEPDVLMLSKTESAQFKKLQRHPNSAALIVEVARTSLSYDRLEKGSLYAQAGVSKYWIVNLNEFSLEIYSEPGPDEPNPFGFAYRTRQVLKSGEKFVFQGREIDPGDFFRDLARV